MSFPMPAIAATIERRLLINYRLDPTVAQELLPASLRPQLVDGSAVAGICLLRLGAFRPAWVRPELGWGAENAAHRIAVEWDDANGTHSGVYVPPRHSASWVPVLAGSRVFPGVHHHGRFDVTEGDGRFRVEMQAPGVDVQWMSRSPPRGRAPYFRPSKTPPRSSVTVPSAGRRIARETWRVWGWKPTAGESRPGLLSKSSRRSSMRSLPGRPSSTVRW